MAGGLNFRVEEDKPPVHNPRRQCAHALPALGTAMIDFLVASATNRRKPWPLEAQQSKPLLGLEFTPTHIACRKDEH